MHILKYYLYFSQKEKERIYIILNYYSFYMLYAHLILFLSVLILT